MPAGGRVKAEQRTLAQSAFSLDEDFWKWAEGIRLEQDGDRFKLCLSPRWG